MVPPHRHVREGEAQDIRKASGKATSDVRLNKQGVFDNAVFIGQPTSATAGRSIVPLICAFLYSGKHLDASAKKVFRSSVGLPFFDNSTLLPATPCFPISCNRYVSCLRRQW